MSWTDVCLSGLCLVGPAAQSRNGDFSHSSSEQTDVRPWERQHCQSKDVLGSDPVGRKEQPAIVQCWLARPAERPETLDTPFHPGVCSRTTTLADGSFSVKTCCCGTVYQVGRTRRPGGHRRGRGTEPRGPWVVVMGFPLISRGVLVCRQERKFNGRNLCVCVFDWGVSQGTVGPCCLGCCLLDRLVLLRRCRSSCRHLKFSVVIKQTWVS